MNRLLILLALFSLASFTSYSTTYTAIASGSYGNTATWQGGLVPSNNLNNHSIIIPSGITVTSNNNFSLSGSSASDMLSVNGTFRCNGSITITDAGFSGTGTIEADSFSGSFKYGIGFIGSLDVDKLNGTGMYINLGTSINVNQRLHIDGDSMTLTDGSLSVQSNAAIFITPNSSNTTERLIVSGAATINLPVVYDLYYMQGSVRTGDEFLQTSIKNLYINVGSGEGLLLKNDLDLNTATLHLLSGSLNLNNKHLSVSGNGDISAAGNGTIKATVPSIVTINKGISSPLKFSAGSSISELVINTSTGVSLGTDIKVTDTLNLKVGKLDVKSFTLSLVTGAVVSGADANKYVVTDGGGFLSSDVKVGSTFTYPVGTQTDYMPCSVSSNNNTVYNGLKVNVIGEVRATGSTGTIISTTQPLVKATWNLFSNTQSSVNANVELGWPQSAEVNGFNRNQAYISQLAGATWDKTASAVTNNNNGNYSIKRDSISFFSQMAVFDNNTVSIRPVTTDNAVELYPNPAKDFIYVNDNDSKTVRIYNTNGRLMISQNITYNNTGINISDLPSGIYIITLSNENQTKSARFLKH